MATMMFYKRINLYNKAVKTKTNKQLNYFKNTKFKTQTDKAKFSNTEKHWYFILAKSIDIVSKKLVNLICHLVQHKIDTNKTEKR